MATWMQKKCNLGKSPLCIYGMTRVHVTNRARILRECTSHYLLRLAPINGNENEILLQTLKILLIRSSSCPRIHNWCSHGQLEASPMHLWYSIFTKPPVQISRPFIQGIYSIPKCFPANTPSYTSATVGLFIFWEHLQYHICTYHQ